MNENGKVGVGKMGAERKAEVIRGRWVQRGKLR